MSAFKDNRIRGWSHDPEHPGDINPSLLRVLAGVDWDVAKGLIIIAIAGIPEMD